MKCTTNNQKQSEIGVPDPIIGLIIFHSFHKCQGQNQLKLHNHIFSESRKTRFAEAKKVKKTSKSIKVENLFWDFLVIRTGIFFI